MNGIEATITGFNDQARVHYFDVIDVDRQERNEKKWNKNVFNATESCLKWINGGGVRFDGLDCRSCSSVISSFD
jgi:aspartate oxidase